MIQVSTKNRERLAVITPKMSLESAQSLGVQKKVAGQSRGFEKLGFQVERFGFKPYQFGVTANRKFNVLQDLYDSQRYNRENFQEILAAVKRFHPDVVYMRYNFSDSHFIRFLQNLRSLLGKEVPFFLEIATFPYGLELRSAGRPGLLLLYWTDLLYRRNLSLFFDYIVTYSDKKTIFRIPTIKIDNGVDVESLRPAVAKNQQRMELEYHIIGVSNLVYWTGYERMILGLAKYRDQGVGKKVLFHVVGDGLYLESLQRLAAQKGVGEYVIFHGAHTGEVLDELFQGKQLAIGNLGVHRKDMVTNPDLKNREYCARGIPFVTSTIDPGFPADFPYLMQATPDESPIEINRLIEFINNIDRNHPDYMSAMRQYAEEHFDWAVTLKPVAEKLKTANRGSNLYS